VFASNTPRVRRQFRVLTFLLCSFVILAIAGGAFLLGRQQLDQRLSSNAMVQVQIPVVKCPSTYQSGELPLALPSSIRIVVPTSMEHKLAFYGDSAHAYGAILGPSGWKCTFGMSTDGSMALQLYPKGVDRLKSENSSNIESISVWDDGSASGSANQTACPYFYAASTSVQHVVSNCGGPSPSSRQRLSFVTLRGVRPNDGGIAEFYDPSHASGLGFPSGGALPATGAFIYVWNPEFPSALLETCVLPRADSNMCNLVTHQFVKHNWIISPN
jgi:hypothetical protein